MPGDVCLHQLSDTAGRKSMCTPASAVWFEWGGSACRLWSNWDVDCRALFVAAAMSPCVCSDKQAIECLRQASWSVEGGIEFFYSSGMQVGARGAAVAAAQHKALQCLPGCQWVLPLQLQLCVMTAGDWITSLPRQSCSPAAVMHGKDI